MTARRNLKSIVISGILHEGMLDDVQAKVDMSKCQGESKDFHTKMVVTGTDAQLDKFVELWNKEA